MTDWEKYVEPAADEMQGHQIGTGFYALSVDADDARAMARAALSVVGPLIVADTQQRLVEAAARAVEREAATDTLTAVRGLHSAKPVRQPSHFTTWCDECQCSWPCRTASLMEGAS